MPKQDRNAPAFARSLAALLIVALIASARVASAWTSPLLPHVQTITFVPDPPIAGRSVGVRVGSTYASECWRLYDAQLADSAHLRVAVEPVSACGDSGSRWTAGWDLGVLAAGPHSMTVHARVENGTLYPTEEEITVPFEVLPAAPPPPPPAPEPDTLTRLVTSIEFTPSSPQLGDRVQVRFRGRYPFDCGSLLDASAADPANLALTLATTPGCADTARAWSETFDLGYPSAGDHLGVLHMLVPAQGLERTQGFDYLVTDPAAPPPDPGPPSDSLRSGLSASVPNPFSGSTSFAVSLADPTDVEVAVFDLGGRRVRTIHRGVLPRGTSNLAWDGRWQDGRRAAGGIYFYRLALPTRVVTRRVVLLGAP